MSFNDATMPVWQEKHLRAATRAAGVALWSWNVDTDARLEGFGSKSIHRSMAAQLGGTIAFDWSEEGVVATLRMRKDRIAK